MAPRLDPDRTGRGFTLLELLVSMVVVSVLMLILIQATTSTSSLWRGTTDKIKSFQSARAAFETITQAVSQATLNTYYEYYDQNGNRYTGQSSFTPVAYDRYSELHFISGPSSEILQGITRKDSEGSKPYSSISPGHSIFFLAPLGYTLDTTQGAVNLDNALNALGYFVEFSSDKDMLPAPVASKVTPRYRYRLLQLFQPTEDLSVYSENWATHSNGASAGWFGTPLGLSIANAGNVRPASVLADNVVFLIIRPKRSSKEYEASNPKPPAIAPNYLYDSRPQPVIKPSQTDAFPTRHQLPPIVAVTLVAIDEASAIRLEEKYGSTPPLQALGLSNLFRLTGDTNEPADYDADMDKMKKAFVENRINFRIFETEVMIRSSKWTKN